MFEAAELEAPMQPLLDALLPLAQLTLLRGPAPGAAAPVLTTLAPLLGTLASLLALKSALKRASKIFAAPLPIAVI